MLSYRKQEKGELMRYQNLPLKNWDQNNSDKNKGLIGKSQVEQAANFIRYASGIVSPTTSISRNTYNALLTQTLEKKDETAAQRSAREDALASLTTYLTQVRVYAAQSSVAISNLYYILSKRLPQDNQQLNGSSQAVSELEMATRRLYKPNLKANEKQWIDSINSASPTTVQKEMALLLAEINYQLYLNRQQEERLLLTNSILLIQNLTQAKPEGNDVKVQEASEQTADQQQTTDE